MATITKGDTSYISANFTAAELYSKSPDAPNSHYLSDEVIKGAQIIRDWVGEPVYINSSYRTAAHNASIGGASNSQHLVGNALDLSFKTENAKNLVINDIATKGQLYQKLKFNAIRGFGLYDNFVHIDSRTATNPVIWDNRKKKS